MKYLFPALLLLMIISCSDSENESNNTETAKADLEQLLGDFLKGASENDADMHNSFWADDLIYTSSAGTRTTKADIMSSFDTDQPSDSEPGPQYGYEDLQIKVYDDAAVVAFQLIGTVGTEDSREVTRYFNTGTFINRNGEWRAVAWQATRIP